MIQIHAEKAADQALTKSACPYDPNSANGQMWLDYFYSRVMWLSGESSA
jgi:hypothetical protein